MEDDPSWLALHQTVSERVFEFQRGEKTASGRLLFNPWMKNYKTVQCVI